MTQADVVRRIIEELEGCEWIESIAEIEPGSNEVGLTDEDGEIYFFQVEPG